MLRFSNNDVVNYFLAMSVLKSDAAGAAATYRLGG